MGVPTPTKIRKAGGYVAQQIAAALMAGLGEEHRGQVEYDAAIMARAPRMDAAIRRVLEIGGPELPEWEINLLKEALE